MCLLLGNSDEVRCPRWPHIVWFELWWEGAYFRPTVEMESNALVSSGATTTDMIGTMSAVRSRVRNANDQVSIMPSNRINNPVIVGQAAAQLINRLRIIWAS